MGLLDSWKAATQTLFSPVNSILSPPTNAQPATQPLIQAKAQLPSVLAANPLQPTVNATPKPDFTQSPYTFTFNNKIPALANNEEATYRANVTTPTTIPQPAGIQDIPGAVSAAYKAAGGGVGGVGAGALAGLGKAGEFIATRTGQNILAGSTGNPWLAGGYLQGAEQARQNELLLRQGAIQQNMEKMKAQGEDVRARNAQEADLIKTKTQNKMELPLKIAQLFFG